MASTRMVSANAGGSRLDARAAVRAVLSSADTVQSALRQGAVAAYMPAAELGPDLARESAAWAKIIKDRKITAE